jgi:hypothetical protein
VAASTNASSITFTERPHLGTLIREQQLIRRPVSVALFSMMRTSSKGRRFI